MDQPIEHKKDAVTTPAKEVVATPAVVVPPAATAPPVAAVLAK